MKYEMKKYACIRYVYRITSVVLLCVMLFFDCKAQNIYTIDQIIDRVMCCSPGYKLYQMQTIVNKRTYEINIMSLLPAVGFSFSGPAYSKSISPVSQPDGSFKYLEVNNLQYNSSLTASIPIELTGGQLTFNSNFSMYENNREYNSSKSYSFNYYRVSFNQPLDFFSINRWNRKLAKANRSNAEIDQLEDVIKLKYNALRLYFELIQGSFTLEQLSHQKESLQRLYEYAKEAYKSGRVIKTEVENIELKILNIENRLMLEQENMKKRLELLNIDTGLALTVKGAQFSCPTIARFIVDTDIALSNLITKINTKYDVQLLTQKRTVSQIKHKRWGSASLSIGVGMSASASSFGSLSDSKMMDYNTSLNLSFPITSLFSQKKEYENSKSNYEKLLINKQEYMDQQRIELLNLIASINMNNRKYDYLLKKRALLKQEEQVKLNLFKLQRIMYNSLDEVIDEQLLNANEIVQTIANSFLIACQIERMTLVDFINIRSKCKWSIE